MAGALGVPDFVYRPSIVAKGSGSRELGDGLLAAGDDGLVIQVKSRLAESGLNDDMDRAKRWCRKNAARARSQGLVTRRLLAKGGIPALSLRGYPRVLP